MIDIGIDNITKSYGYKKILDGISFDIIAKEKIAIVGSNGVGKSTLFKIIIGKEKADTGKIHYRKQATIGYLEQLPKVVQTNKTVLEMLMDSFKDVLQLQKQMQKLEKEMAVENEDLDRILARYAKIQNQFMALDGYLIEEKVTKITTSLKLQTVLTQTFTSLSGGERTLVQLAAILLQEPDILLLDEPTNHLDMQMLDWLEKYLRNYQGTVLIISHDRYFLDRVINKTIVLEAGDFQVFHGNYSYAMREQERLLLLAFEKYKNQQKKLTAMKESAKRLRQWAQQSDNAKFYKKAKLIESQIEKIEVLDKPKLEVTKLPLYFKEEYLGKDVISVKDVSYNIGGKQLFDTINFSIYRKDKVAIIGNNGCGKTTLIELLLQQKQGHGNIKVAKKAKVGYIPQNINFSNPKHTILEAFVEGCPALKQEARSILAKYMFVGKEVFKRVGTLSGGEKVILKLAMLLQDSVNLLILDEPTNHIDIHLREVL